nr:MAG TPA: propeller protein [Caudoviricetes sp.]
MTTDGRIYFRYGWESGFMKSTDSLFYRAGGI